MDAETARHNQLAREAFGRNRPDLAELSLRRLLAREPRQAWGMAALAASLHHQRRYEEAMEQARRAVTTFPTYGYAHFTLGVVLAITEDMDGSLQHGLEAIRLAPSRARYYGLPAVLYNELEQFPQAVQVLRDGLAIEPDNRPLQRLFASALAGCGDVTAARAVVAEVFRVAPDDAGTYLNAGMVDWRLGELPGAERNLRQVLARNPLSYDAHGILGQVLLKAGRASEAAFHLRESLRLNPYTRRVQVALRDAERLYLADGGPPGD